MVIQTAGWACSSEPKPTGRAYPRVIFRWAKNESHLFHEWQFAPFAVDLQRCTVVLIDDTML